MNFALPPDNDWTRIAQLTGDNDWLPENMRNFFVELEINQYLPPGVPGHGYDGYIEVWWPCFV
jgi:choline dehydrogenase